MKTEFIDATGRDFERGVEQAARLLRAGEVVAFPTETVYGLGANGLDAEAIHRVFLAKGRPADNPLILHVPDVDAIAKCAILDERVERLSGAFMPGPLTLVLPSRPVVPLIARAGLPTVAVRIPDHPVALALLRAAGPLVAPSANISGRPSPTTAEHVRADLAGKIAAILDGGACRVGIESTVLDLTAEVPAVLRPGSVSAGAIANVLGEPVVGAASSDENGEGDGPKAPGMKYRHYAPGIPVRLAIADSPPAAMWRERSVLILTTERHLHHFEEGSVAALGEATLYGLFRRAEEEGYQEILVYASPGELSEGLLNRIRKAVSGSE